MYLHQCNENDVSNLLSNLAKLHKPKVFPLHILDQHSLNMTIGLFSLLNVRSRVFGHRMYIRVNELFDQFSLFYHEDFGSRQKHN